jgi:hypothetical protein
MALADRAGTEGRTPRRAVPHVCVVSDPDGSGWLMQEITEQLPGWV